MNVWVEKDDDNDETGWVSWEDMGPDSPGRVELWLMAQAWLDAKRGKRDE